MRIRPRLIALLLLCAAAAPAAADEAGEALVKSLIDRIDKHDAWSAAATRVASEGPATLIEGLKIARVDGSAGLDVAAVRLDKLAEKSGGGISIESFAASGLKFGGGAWTFTIPEATGRGLSTAGFDGWNFDPKMPLTSLARFYTGLAATEFDEVAIPKAEFSQEIEVPGSPTKASARASYVNFRLDALKKGVLAGQSIERMESVTTGTTPEPITTVFEGLSAKNVDLGAFAHVFDPAAYAGGKGDGLWKVAFETASYARLAVKTGTREAFTAGPITTAGWQVRQTSEPIAPLFDELLAGGEPSEDKLNSFMQEHFADLVGWFKIGSISVKDVAAYPPEGGKIALASAIIEDLSAETMKRLGLDGFSGDSSAMMVKFKTFEMGDVVWPNISTLITLAKLDEAKNKGTLPDPALIDAAASGIMGVLPRVGQLTISGVEIGVAGGEPFKLGEYTATSEGGSALLPKNAKAKISQIVIPRNLLHATPESGQVFDALGYNELVIEGEGEASHDDASGRYSGTGRIAVKEAGALSLAHAIGGLTQDRITAIMKPFAASTGGEPDQMQLMAAAGPISIEGFTLRFDDASLLKRVLPLAAKMQGMDEATVIGNTTAMLQIGLMVLGNQTFTSEVVNAVGTFLKDPKSLTIALRPAQPVTIQQLMGLDPSKPGAAIDLLGVHVTAND